ncbi:ferritin-like domain-containing protein [Gordonia sp. LSe1-13]|uniref:Ferritin-like domain-containing protein n=1 Tax=Gordonia sesuvii TaxID=3116777 RepID=A0ABU7MBZ8_9ACTN|nr:ferritin-like domain-containing protein [Gordonia sp. LSe1-13]
MTATTDALSIAVDTENAAIFTYGVSTAFVSAARRPTVAEYVAAHRVQRDALVDALNSADATVPEAAAGYTLPVEIDDSVTAVRALLSAEVDCTVAYRALIEQGDTPEIRRMALDGLTAASVRAANWRVALRDSPVTVAFPGSTG